MSYDNLVNNSRLSGEKIKLSNIRAKVLRHSHECLLTVIRMKIKLMLHSWEGHENSHECLGTVIQQSCDYEGGSESSVIGVITLLIYMIGCCIIP